MAKIPLEKQIEQLEEIKTDVDYDLERKRSPREKRRLQRVIEFYDSLIDSLKELQTLKK